MAAVALVCVPVLVFEWPREVARWHRDAARELDLQGDPAGAVAHMDLAIARNDQDADLYVKRAEYKARLQQWQSALDDCIRARQLEPGNLEAGQLRIALLQHLGRHAELVADLREAVQKGGHLPPPLQALQLNNYAYAAAVGNRELAEGLAAVQVALQIVGNVAAMRDPAGVMYFGQAVTEHERGDDLAALASLDAARDHAEAAWRAVSRQAEVQSEVDARRSSALAEEVEALRAHLAGILKLHLDICRQLGRADEAARDQQLRETLAVDGNLAEVRPYGLRTAFDRVHDVSMFLDTRGYLYYQLRDFDAALNDLELAVPAAEAVVLGGPWRLDLDKHNMSDVRPALRQQEELKRALAVITYHRALVFEALGLQREAQQDRDRVRELGYEPDERLF